jgi:transposase
MKIEAIGPQTATALVASIGDTHVYTDGRSFAASLGIAPRQHSSGGSTKLGQITRGEIDTFELSSSTARGRTGIR